MIFKHIEINSTLKLVSFFKNTYLMFFTKPSNVLENQRTVVRSNLQWMGWICNYRVTIEGKTSMEKICFVLDNVYMGGGVNSMSKTEQIF